MSVCIKISDISYRICVDCPEVPPMFERYICEDTPDCVDIFVSNGDLRWEAEHAEEPADFLLSAILRKIAIHALQNDRLLIHGACIAYEGKGYLFVAPSGTGKTSHIRLWMQYLGDSVQVVNGDKPMLRLTPEITAFGTPWNGKEGYGNPISVPLAAIVEIRQAKENRMTLRKKADAFSVLYRQCYMLGAGENSVLQLMRGVKILADRLPVYTLECDLSREAFLCAYEALTERKY